MKSKPPGNPRNANGNARRKLRARLKAMGMDCHLCGMPIDYSLPSGHPMSFEVDELVPVSRGGDPLDFSNVAAAHRICNQKRGNKPVQTFRAERGCGGGCGTGASRDWLRG